MAAAESVIKGRLMTSQAGAPSGDLADPQQAGGQDGIQKRAAGSQRVLVNYCQFSN